MSPTLTAPIDRAAIFAEVIRAIQPGLRGLGPRSYTLPQELRAAMATWTTTPTVPRETTPYPQPRNLRRTLSDIMPTVQSGPVADVPALTVGAAAVPHAMGVAKTESGLTFGKAQETLKSIATWIQLTDELAEDAPSLQPWLETFLEYLVRVGEENELLSGTRGFMVRAGIAIDTGSATDIPAMLARMHGAVVANSGGIEPDTYVLNPADWATVVASGAATVDATASIMNGCDVIRTPALVAGTALVGACQSAAVILRNGTIMVEGTQSHDLNFSKNISMIRAASRIALGILIPTAFIKH